MRACGVAVLAAALLAVTAWESPARVIRVPADAGRIDLALLLAAPYDTILVAPGAYPTNVVWPAKAGIKLLSEAGAAATVLDGGNDVQVIGIYSGVDTTTVIRGFTITKGHAEGQ